MILMKEFKNRKWHLVLYQNSSNGYISKEAINESYSDTAFSLLGQIDSLKHSLSNRYVFLLEYPGLDGFNMFSQKISPHKLECTETDPSFRCIKCTWTNRFGPLKLTGPEASKYGYLTDDTRYDDWWYGIGAYRYESNKITGPIITESNKIKLYEVRLWIQTDGNRMTKCKFNRNAMNRLSLLLSFIVMFK